MKFNRIDPKCYVAHIKCLVAMLFAYFLSVKWLKQKQDRPTVMMYSHSLSGNIKAFLDYTIEKVNLPYETYYTTIDRDEYDKLRDTYGDKILLATKVSVLKKILNASIMMTSHGPGIFYLLKWLSPNTKFVDVWHGVGFKLEKQQQHSLTRFYSAFFVSSDYFKKQIWISRYKFSERKVVVTGYARTDKFQSANTIAQFVRQELDLTETKYTVLFAPTWRKNEINREIPFGLSQESFCKQMNDLCEKVDATFIFRLHRNSTLRFFDGNYSRVRTISQQDYSETNDLLTAIDLLITDWSSIACDFYTLSRPVIYIENPVPSTHQSEMPGVNRIGDHVNNFNELIRAIEKNLQLDKDKIREMLSEVLSKCYGNTLDGCSSQRYDAAIRGLLRNSTFF